MFKKYAVSLLGVAVALLFLFGLHTKYTAMPLCADLLVLFLIILPSLPMPISSFLPAGKARIVTERIGKATVGAYLYILLILFSDCLVLFAAHCSGLFSLSGGILFGVSAAVYAGIICAAVLHAGRIKTVRRCIALPQTEEKNVPEKAGKKILVAVISDLHLGYFTTKKLLSRIGRSVKDLNADMIFIPGDLFDSDASELRNRKEALDMFCRILPPGGCYFCPGNHDFNALSDPDAQKFISDAGITLLSDAGCALPGFFLFGRKDKSEKRLSEREAVKNARKPLVVLDHRPTGARKLIDAGASLVVCGHTHNGQTFPGNLLERLKSKYSHGLKRYKNGYILTTAGCGYWGIPLRLFAANEVVLLEILLP